MLQGSPDFWVVTLEASISRPQEALLVNHGCTGTLVSSGPCRQAHTSRVLRKPGLQLILLNRSCFGKILGQASICLQVLAVDISIWLNQAVRGMRDKSGHAVPHAHLVLFRV